MAQGNDQTSKRENSHREFIDGLKSYKTPATGQLVLVFDGRTLKAETTNPLNGQRRKIDLPPDFMARNPELAAELKSQLAAVEAQRERMLAAPKVETRDPEVVRTERLARERREREERWNNWLATLTESERQAAIAKRDAKLAASAAAVREMQSRNIQYIGEYHDVGLAKRWANGSIHVSRAARRVQKLDSFGNPIPTARRKSSSGGQIIDIDIDEI